MLDYTSECSNKAPANTTTPVVPSPISWSWDFESSTKSFPIWFSTSICSKIVAPSFAAIRFAQIEFTSRQAKKGLEYPFYGTSAKSWTTGMHRVCANYRTSICSLLFKGMMRFCYSVKASQRQGASLMHTSPSGPWSNLSMPFGPRDDLRILAMAFADLMCALWASIPRIRCFFSCSCTDGTGQCPDSCCVIAPPSYSELHWQVETELSEPSQWKSILEWLNKRICLEVVETASMEVTDWNVRALEGHASPW